MSHPDERQWMKFLYGELEEPRVTSMERHIETCESCRQQCARMRALASRLDSWEANEPASLESLDCDAVILRATQSVTFAGAMASKLSAAWPWLVTAAALALAALSFSLGRWSGSARLTAVVRQELAHTLRRDSALDAEKSQALRELVEQTTRRSWETAKHDLSRELQQQQTLLQQRMEKLLGQVASDQLALRRDLQTLAVEAESRLRQTQRNLAELSMFTGHRIETWSPAN